MNAHSQRRLGFEGLEARRLLAVEILLTGSGEMLDLPVTQLCDVSKVDICGSGDNTVVLNAEWVNESCVDGSMKIISDTGDHIELTDAGWKFDNARADEGSIVREFKSGEATLQIVGPDDLTNPIDAKDVSGNGEATALDVLLIINELQARRFSDPENGAIVDTATMPLEQFRFYDVSGNHMISSLDALQVINGLSSEDVAVRTVAKEEVAPQLLPVQVLASEPVIAQRVSRQETVETFDEGGGDLINANFDVARQLASAHVQSEPLLIVPTEDETSSALSSTAVDALMLDTTLEFCNDKPCID